MHTNINYIATFEVQANVLPERQVEHLAQVSGGLQVGEDAALDVVVLHPTHVPARLAAVLHLKLEFILITLHIYNVT